METVYTPLYVIACYQNALSISAETCPIQVKGIYVPDPSNKIYSGYFYDRIREEQDKGELVIKVRPNLRQSLLPQANKLVTVQGVLSRKVRIDSTIAVSLSLMSVLQVEESQVSESEKRFWELQRTKSEAGKKDVSLLCKNLLFSNKHPKVALVWASTSCTRTEFNNAAGNAAQHIEFVDHQTVFSNVRQTVRLLQSLDGQYDAIALIRGGGSGLEAFDDNELLSCVVRMKSAVISAVGHAEEKHKLKLLADLVIDTPTALGKFFSDLTETVISEKSRSKAALVEEVRKQFAERIAADAKTKEQLQNQLRAATEAQQKADKLHTEQVQGLQKQLVEITHTNKQKDETNQQQIRTLTEQIKSLNGTHQQQIQAANKHMEELQRQLAEAASKEEARFRTLQEGFAAQTESMKGQLATMQRDVENRTRELAERSKEVEQLRLLTASAMSTTKAILIAVATFMAGALLAAFLF